jgi:predicted AAA+ superfamily ATPase
MRFPRLCKPSNSRSFFLFGARGTGKSTLIHNLLGNADALWIDLLDPDLEDRYSRHPAALLEQVRARHRDSVVGLWDWIVIDEIQKVPRLLDVVHAILESREFTSPKFALTGSSARKLRHGGANLLAGRAFVQNLHPLTFLELGDSFDLDSTLNWGSLPEIFQLQDDGQRRDYLTSYGRTYLREEVWNEHLVHKLEPFRQFLEVAAQASGQPVNASAIARDVGVDDKTVRKYFQILEDTLLGFFLEPFSRSVRKRQLQASKFYFFDLGVQRSLERSLRQHIVPGTFAFGRAFEHFIVLEMIRLNDTFRLDHRFSHLRTKDGVEIDLVVERPGEPPALVEIKSSNRTTRHDSRHLLPFLADIPGAVGYCISLDPLEREIDGIRHLPWRKAFQELGLIGFST